MSVRKQVVFESLHDESLYDDIDKTGAGFLPPDINTGRWVYLAGPMTGIPHFNFPLFHKAAEDLRLRGFIVTSPAELDSPESKAAAEASPDGDASHYAKGESWGDLLARDVKLIADGGIEAIVVLPGWPQSKGARLETFVGRLCKLPILVYPSLEPALNRDIDQAHGNTINVPTTDSSWCALHSINNQQAVDFDNGGEVRVTNSETGGQKGTKGLSWSLLPWVELAEVAKLYTAGMHKYTRNNWRKGYDWHLSMDSALNHLMEFWENGNSVDKETKCHHLASVIFHMLALMYFEKHHPDLDDRPIRSTSSK